MKHENRNKNWTKRQTILTSQSPYRALTKVRAKDRRKKSLHTFPANLLRKREGN